MTACIMAAVRHALRPSSSRWERVAGVGKIQTFARWRADLALSSGLDPRFRAAPSSILQCQYQLQFVNHKSEYPFDSANHQNDIFQIQLSNGYFAGGDLGGSRPD